MTPKEKAKELFDKFSNVPLLDDYEAKQCALIAVDEILNLMINNFKWDINYNGNIEYWQQVKQEIQAL
jgi:hypothetical protein